MNATNLDPAHPLAQDLRMMHLQNDHVCGECSQRTRYAATGIHVFVCSPECLRKQVARLVHNMGLAEYVELKP